MVFFSQALNSCQASDIDFLEIDIIFIIEKIESNLGKTSFSFFSIGYLDYFYRIFVIR